MTYTVTIYTRRGYPFSQLSFSDEKKAKDYYTDCLVRYPDYNVEFNESKI